MNSIEQSSKTLLLSFNNVAASAINLYTGLDRILDSGVQVDRANLSLAKSAERVHDAQDNLNKVISKFGVDSEVAVEAGKTLVLAQEGYRVAAERANVAVDTQRRAMLNFAVSVIPTVITAAASLNSILSALNLTDAAGNAITLASISGLLGKAAARVGDTIATAAYTVSRWAANAAEMVGISLETLGIGTAIALGAAVAGLAVMYALQARNVDAANASTIAASESLNDMGKITPATANAINGLADACYRARNATDNLDVALATVTAEYKNAKKAIDDQINSLSVLTVVEIGHANQSDKESPRNKMIEDSVRRLRQEMDGLDASYAKTTEQINAKIKAQEEEKRAQDVLTNLVDEYNLSLAEASLKMNSYAESFQTAFGGGQIQDAVDVAKSFAAEFSISLDDAVRTLQNFQVKATDAFSNLSDEAKMYLTGQTQDTVAKFKDCAGGKLEALKEKVENLDIFEAIKISAGIFETPTVTLPTVESAAAGIQALKRLLYVPAMAEGGIVTKPTFAMLGESGPEVILPLNQGGSLAGNTFNINFNVDGSVDRRTAEYAAKLIEERLKNVVVEPSSVSASSTHKKIRFGS